MIDWKKFLKDAEQCCFDCGSTDKNFTKISDGVVLCDHCHKIAKEDYQKEISNEQQILTLE